VIAAFDMPQLLVRDIESAVVKELRRRATAEGVSVEEAHRRVLRSALVGTAARPEKTSSPICAAFRRARRSRFPGQRICHEQAGRDRVESRDSALSPAATGCFWQRDFGRGFASRRPIGEGRLVSAIGFEDFGFHRAGCLDGGGATTTLQPPGRKGVSSTPFIHGSHRPEIRRHLGR
jgi:plasmid stability protein